PAGPCRSPFSAPRTTATGSASSVCRRASSPRRRRSVSRCCWTTSAATCCWCRRRSACPPAAPSVSCDGRTPLRPCMPTDRRTAARLVAIVCAAQVFVQLGAGYWPVLMPELMGRWSLSNSEAGWITSAFYAAYMVSVPVLVTLTDRIDAKRVYLFGVGCLELRRAAEVGAHPLPHHDLGLLRAVFVLCVLRLLGSFRCRVGQPRRDGFQGLEHFLGAADHPDGLAAPLDDRELARRNLRDVGLDRRAGGARTLGWPHAGNEGHRGADPGDAAGDRARDHQVAPRLVYFYFFIHGDGVVVEIIGAGAKTCDSSDGSRKSPRFRF